VGECRRAAQGDGHDREGGVHGPEAREHGTIADHHVGCAPQLHHASAEVGQARPARPGALGVGDAGLEQAVGGRRAPMGVEPLGHDAHREGRGVEAERAADPAAIFAVPQTVRVRGRSRKQGGTPVIGPRVDRHREGVGAVAQLAGGFSKEQARVLRWTWRRGVGAARRLGEDEVGEARSLRHRAMPLAQRADGSERHARSRF